MYIYIYIQVYIYICILTLVSAAVYACTKGKVVEQFPQLLPLPHKRFLSSVDIDVRRFASSPLPSPIFFSPLPLFFLLLSFLFFFFIILIFIPRFNSDKITAPRQFSLRKYPNDSALMILIIDKYLYNIQIFRYSVEWFSKVGLFNFYAKWIYLSLSRRYRIFFEKKKKVKIWPRKG